MPEEGATRLLLNSGTNALKARPNFLERQRLAQPKIQIPGKTIIGEVAAFQRRSSLESQCRLQVGFGEAAQKPGEAIIPFENVFPNTHAAGLETIGQPEMFLGGITHERHRGW
jgi:hypothetical protein